MVALMAPNIRFSRRIARSPLFRAASWSKLSSANETFADTRCSIETICPSIDRGSCRGHLLGGHAAAGVEQEAETDRDPIVAEVRHVLQLPVLVDGEVLSPKPGDESSVLVGDCRGDVDEIDAAPESEPFL